MNGDALTLRPEGTAGVVRAALLSRFGATAHDGESWTSPLDLEVLRSMIDHR